MQNISELALEIATVASKAVPHLIVYYTIVGALNLAKYLNMRQKADIAIERINNMPEYKNTLNGIKISPELYVDAKRYLKAKRSRNPITFTKTAANTIFGVPKRRKHFSKEQFDTLQQIELSSKTQRN